MKCENCKMIISDRFKPDPVLQPGLITENEPREWVNLTSEEIQKIEYDIRSETIGVKSIVYLARAIEAKLKEKNT